MERWLTARTGIGLLGVLLIGVFLLSDGFGFLLALLVAVGIVNGYWIGASRIAALLGGLLAATVVGIPAGKAMEGVVSSILNTSGAMNRVISIGLCALVVFLIVTAVLQIVIRRKLKDASTWKPYDRPVGAGLGLLQGVVIACVLAWSLLGLEPIAAVSLAQTGEADANPVSDWIVSTAEKVRDSAIGDFADSINPLNDAKFMTLLADALAVLSDPESRQAFLAHPAMKRVENYDSVQQALRMLEADEALCRTLESEKTGAIMRAMFSSTTVLAVLDDTDIVADLTPMADEIELAIREAKQYKDP